MSRSPRTSTSCETIIWSQHQASEGPCPSARPSGCSALSSACSPPRGTSPPSRSVRPCRAIPSRTSCSSGCSSGTRRISAISACRWRQASTIRLTTTPATGSGSRLTSCLNCGWKPTRPPCSAWPPGSGGGPNWPEPAFGPLWEAVRDRRPVTFSYRAAGRSDPQRRELEPWGVVNRHGRWYVAGWDRGRDAIRVFRLGRIAGAVKFCGPVGRVIVPEGTDVRELVRDWDSAPAQERTALLRVRTAGGVGLRRHAVSVQPDESAPGWDLVTTRFADLGWFADYAASFGPDV